MSHVPPSRWLGYPLQALCYAAFIAVVGTFATSPRYRHLEPGRAVVKLSFQHAGQLKQPCRERSAEELAKLAPNMRAASVCPRERANVEVDVAMDGKPLFTLVAPPSGLARDGASTVYRRFEVPAGAHSFVAKLKDSASGDFGYVQERAVDIPAGRVLVIDFDAKEGGWKFRG
jgi:hypothetical protein